MSITHACNRSTISSPVTPAETTSTGPTYALPPTHPFPTPLVTPTRAPTPQIPAGMEINEELNIHYKSDEKLDVYSPVIQNHWPVVLILHGGGVDKKSIRSLSVVLAEQGAVVFTPEYQSYEPPPDQILTGVNDAACAVRYARAHAGEYGGDPDRVIVVGHSAGGAFGAVISLAGDRFHGDCLVEEGSAIPDRFIGLDGAYDILRYTSEERLRMASPDEWVWMSPYTHISATDGQGNPSFYLFVGEEAVLLQDAQAFRDALLEHGYSATLTQFPGIDHMYMASGNHANTVFAIVSIMRESAD